MNNEQFCHAGFVIYHTHDTHANESDYKSDSFITPDYKSGVTSMDIEL